METGKRLGLALAVVALLAGLTTIAPQLPADASGQASFTHVFGDGDPGDKEVYSVPDDFTFTDGAYALAITGTVYFADDPVPDPTVTGKGLDWALLWDGDFPARTGERIWIAVYGAWADDPSDPSLYDMTFDFGDATEIHRHVRSFEESTDIDRVDDDPTQPIVQVASKTGSGQAADVELSAFEDPDNSTTLFAVFKHLSGSYDSTTLTELADTRVGTPNPPDPETGDPLRMLTAYTGGEDLNPLATWSNDDAIWESIGIEVSTDARTVETTTTTEATTTTTTESTTTTTVPTTTTTVAEIEPPDDDPFVDDDDSIFEDDIEAIAALGITLGCNPPANDHFCPDDTLTRGQMAAFMARALDLTSNPIDRFIDDDNSVFESNIEAIAEAGITLGCNPPANDRYCPEDTLTRGQMAAFMARALGLTGDTVDRFVDDDASVFEHDIELIASAGITLGCNPPANDHYCPADTLTRGQMAAFLNRMLTYLSS